MQLSGGQLLPPVQKLVATIIFATGENANRIHHPPPKIAKLRQKIGDFYFFTITYSLFTESHPAIFGK